MTKSPIIWGAGLACALGGAVAGNALGSTPPLDRSTIEMMYQSHEAGVQDARPGVPPPDHYPLVTRSGTVPVAELSMRGLYSQARYRAYVYAADYGPLDLAPDYRPDEEPARYQSADESVRIGDPDVRPEATEPTEPLQLAAGPATVASAQGNARLIDVEATLAMR